jgi:hypothetical protein
VALAKVEEAYRAETETKETIEEVIEFASFYQLKDYMNASDDGADENRLLPAINKIWPFCVACIRNRNPVVQSLSPSSEFISRLMDYKTCCIFHRLYGDA